MAASDTVPSPIVITGATATGKTALALAVARELNAEIIALDSRTVYRGLNIGTAKPTPAEQRAIPHHGLDLIDPDQRYSAGQFARDARCWIDRINDRGNLPMLVGGTGFFLKALTDPMFREPELSPDRREALKEWLDQRSDEQLTAWLEALDPNNADRLAAAGGRQRRTRALEIALLSGRTLGWWQQNSPAAEPPLRPLVFVLEYPREELYRRINQRVIAMIEAGWVDEVRTLLDRGIAATAPGLNATGYPEIVRFLHQDSDLAETIDAVQRATRQFARRQLTWFRHQLPANAVRLDAARPFSELAAVITQTVSENR